MEPASYIPRYLECEYLRTHPDLTPAAQRLVREEITAHPERFATGEHARSLVAYARVHNRLLRELARMDNLPDEEFEQRRNALFDSARAELRGIGEADRLCVDARLTDIMLADVPLDALINDLLSLERSVAEYLTGGVLGFSADAPHFWDETALQDDGVDAAERTSSEPEVIGWLHTLEAIAELCLASARYRAAAQYARRVMQARGYPNNARGTLLLALARLELEDEFFALVESEGEEDEHGWGPIAGSPWYLLSRVILLYKTGRERAARRALKEFAQRCDGGAFFLLNPVYLTPYLPVRPPTEHAWEQSHQAVWEADGIIADCPDFGTWAADVPGIGEISESFARKNGF
ncbi:hypothetical protein [Collinsella vaginalis]|uniref:hypothetical protein n=1 Tax=Collinsella vaginalis TaxID=1870987 RepID=UPI000A26D0E9|nr:hypothetical protein [Collinsella vaginalis]